MAEPAIALLWPTSNPRSRSAALKSVAGASVATIEAPNWTPAASDRTPSDAVLPKADCSN